MSPPRVSVVIPNYNYARYLPQAIDSALGQTYPHVEVVVVDDGSTDESLNALRGYGSRVRWVRQERQGVSAARNRGVRESHGELVAFLDADDRWLPRKLESQVARWCAEPELGLVHAGEELIDERGAIVSTRVNGLEGWVAGEMLLLQRVVIVAPCSSSVVPRRTFEAVGGFDHRLSSFADWDFCFRVACRQRVGFVPERLVQVRVHRGSMQRNISVIAHDMLLAFDKAFRDAPPTIQSLRRQAYGRLHLLLAGSFFYARRPVACARHLVHGAWLVPDECGARLVDLPGRRRRRQVLSSMVSS